jgi:nucleotide-binding universal stress UspA family protein
LRAIGHPAPQRRRARFFHGSSIGKEATMQLGRILVANDFSPNSGPALELAADLALRLHATVDVLHVFEQALPQFGEPMLPAGGNERTLDEIVHARTAAELHRCVRSLQRRGIDAKGRVEIGDPAQLIVAWSDHYDLIVMGTHGRRGISRLVNGSVAEQVIRRAACPVLTSRPIPDPQEVSHD